MERTWRQQGDSKSGATVSVGHVAANAEPDQPLGVLPELLGALRLLLQAQEHWQWHCQCHSSTGTVKYGCQPQPMGSASGAFLTRFLGLRPVMCSLPLQPNQALHLLTQQAQGLCTLIVQLC